MSRLACPQGHALAAGDILDDATQGRRVYGCKKCRAEGTPWVWKIEIPRSHEIAQRVIDGDEKTIRRLLPAPPGVLTRALANEAGPGEHTNERLALVARAENILAQRRTQA